MPGTGTNKGNQDIQFKYYDPLNSDHFDKRNQEIIPIGIYDGGLCTIISDTSVEVSPMVVEISDGQHQARVRTQSAYTVTGLSSGNPYIVLSWNWVGLVAWYMDIKPSSISIDANDIILAKCIYVGGTLSSIQYITELRNANGVQIGQSRVPRTIEEFLKPCALPTPGMQIFVNGGWITYGASRILVHGQISPVITAPAANKRIDLVWIDTGGNVQIVTGTESPSPSAPGWAAARMSPSCPPPWPSSHRRSTRTPLPPGSCRRS